MPSQKDSDEAHDHQAKCAKYSPSSKRALLFGLKTDLSLIFNPSGNLPSSPLLIRMMFSDTSVNYEEGKCAMSDALDFNLPTPL